MNQQRLCAFVFLLLLSFTQNSPVHDWHVHCVVLQEAELSVPVIGFVHVYAPATPTLPRIVLCSPNTIGWLSSSAALFFSVL